VFTQNLSCYVPELFFGLVLKIQSATLLISGSEKIVITGLKKYNEVLRIFSEIYHIITKYNINNRSF